MLAFAASVVLWGLCQARLHTYHFTLHADSRAPDGFQRPVYLVNGQQPGPLIEIDEGDEIEVFVSNQLPVENTIHWHGLFQRNTPYMDGVPGVTQLSIPGGGNFTYRFSTTDQYGFYWYHSHFRAYYDDALRGPLMIHPSPSRARPFESLAKNESEMATLRQVERQAKNLLLNDWTHQLSDTIYSDYMTTGAFPFCVDSILANGVGRVECLPESLLAAGTGLGMALSTVPVPTTMPSGVVSSSMSMTSKMATTSGSIASQATSMVSSMSGMDSMAGMDGMSGMDDMSGLSPRGCTPPMMFRPGFNTNSIPDTCTPTTSKLLVIHANTTLGWMALNFVNSGGVSTLHVSLDAHSMFIYMADGLYVTLQEVQVLEIAIGQRYSVLIKLNQMPGNYYLRYSTYPAGDMQQVLEGQSIISYSGKITNTSMSSPHAMDEVYMLINGSATSNAKELEASKLAPYTGNRPPIGSANVIKFFAINQTGIVDWVVEGAPYSEAKVPILYGNLSDSWRSNTTYHIPLNSTVDIIMQIANDSMDVMGHPMHLHGHKFWVLGSGSGAFPYTSVNEAPASMINLQDPAYRDTANLPAGGWLAVRYVADNPGAWMLHCHIQWHVISGMGVVLVEGEDKIPELLRTGNVSVVATVPGNATSVPPLLSSGGSKFNISRISAMILTAMVLLLI
ncbi:MAG: hypothetical protein M1818_008112 [Claussenomyces sp. TS43310]|nr:MAG: hypothetical protein M1818_008112 [Claussenomyces sp. TS43310]